MGIKQVVGLQSCALELLESPHRFLQMPPEEKPTEALKHNSFVMMTMPVATTMMEVN